MSRRAAATAGGVLLLLTFLGACGHADGQTADPLTRRLASICGFPPGDLSYWGRGSPNFGGRPLPYIWQTADFRHSVSLASATFGGAATSRMYVSCDNNPSRRPITVPEGDLPRETPAVSDGG